MSPETWPSVADLVPHAGDAILIDRVVSHCAKETCVEVIVGNRPALRQSDGSIPSWLAVEFMAQAIAAHEGLLEWSEGRPIPVGFLISVNGAKFETPAFAADEVLTVSARRVRGRPGLGVISHECAVFQTRNTEPVATGRLAIAVDPEANARS